MKKVTNRYRIYCINQFKQPYSVYILITTGRGDYWESVSGNYDTRQCAMQWARRHGVTIEK